MKDNYFDDILKNSMETPRAITFDESAWDRMEQQMPKPATSSAWKTWLKFLPIAIGMLGLLSWNICLQREINYIQNHPNVVIQREVSKPIIIHRVDTIYQITERRITKEAIKNYLEQYVKNSGLSHTNNRFVTPENSYLLKSNFLVTSNSNSRLSGSYNPKSLKSSFITPTNSHFFTNSVYNPNFSNLNIANNFDAAPIDSVQVFANQTSNGNDDLNKKNLLSSENVTTENDTYNSINEGVTENDVAIEEELLHANILNKLENKRIQEVNYFQNLNNLDHIDMVDLSRPSKKTKPTFRSKLRFEEFSLGFGNSMSGNISNNGILFTSGLHAGAYILPNTSVEMEINYLNSNFSSYNSIYPNDIPYPSAQQITADFNLNNIDLITTSVQMSLGLKRIIFKEEHIRPFGEIGWLPNKQISGNVSYTYIKSEGSQTTFQPTERIPLKSADYLKWDLSQVYAGGGLSFSLLKNKVDLDLGVRFTQSLNLLFNYNNPGYFTNTTAIGSFASLTYNF